MFEWVGGLNLPCLVNRSSQLVHWLTIFRMFSGERPLFQRCPRNSNRYRDVIVTVLIFYVFCDSVGPVRLLTTCD
jgi:hypothetical protein